MANSFGYFSNKNDNVKVLKEIRRILRNGGKLLLDLTNSDFVRNNLVPLSWHETGDGVIVCRKRELKNGILRAREIVISKKNGLLRDGSYCKRLYTGGEITTTLNNLGYRDIAVHKDISLHKKSEDYGFLTSRMMVTARK